MSKRLIRNALYVARRKREDGGQVAEPPIEEPTHYDPISVVGRMLPQNVRDAYASLPRAIGSAVTEFSQPAAIRDTVNALGDTTRSALAGQGWDTATNAAKAISAGLAMVPGVGAVERGLKKGIDVFHGGPHTFEKFDASKIGTGEGAQAYGHGLYFAEHPDTARAYRDVGDVSRTLKIGQTPIADYYSALERNLAKLPADKAATGYDRLALLEDLAHGGDPLHIRERAEQGVYSPEAMQWFEKEIAPNFTRKGHLYQTRINADPEDFLHWDRPLHEQPAKVKSALEKFGLNAPEIAPEPKSSAVRNIVRQALRQNEGIPRDIGMVVDNDRPMYERAREILVRRGHDPEEISPGDFIEKEAGPYLRSLHERMNFTGGSAYGRLASTIKRGEDKPWTSGAAAEEDVKQGHILASEALRSAGVPGIRYLDQGSRAGGAGTHNYVMFPGNEHLIDVLKRYKRGGRVNHQPTEAQKVAGNYAKEHVNFQGLPISIENKKGSERSGVGPDGKRWSCRLPADYGYIKRTEGADGDHLDVYVGPEKDSKQVFLINQKDHRTGKFDEHKAMLGYHSERQALADYCQAFSDGKGHARIGSVETMSLDGFKHWLKAGDTTRPANTRQAINHAILLARKGVHTRHGRTVKFV